MQDQAACCALGAGRGAILGNVLRQGVILTACGLMAGIAVSVFLTRFLRAMLYGVGATDFLTLASVAIVLCVVSLLACYLPAMRAAAVDPVQALRRE